MLPPVAPCSPPLPPRPAPDPMREAAIALEATFLAEMLKSAGLGRGADAFGGGAGEDQFASFLLHEQATAMARAGGIGLAETIHLALRERADV